MCCSIMCFYVLSSVLWCPLRFPHKKRCSIRLYFQLFRRAHILFKLFVFVFLFCLSSSCVPYVASFSGLFLFCFSSSCVPYIASFSAWIMHFWLPLRYSLTFISENEYFILQEYHYRAPLPICGIALGCIDLETHEVL